MTPGVYMDEIVLPTVKEFMEARHDRRRAYLACIAAFHVCDYVARAEGSGPGKIHAPIRAACEPAFNVIDGICNGSKHCGRDRGAYRHDPGSERDVPVFAFDTPGAGWGQGRLGVPGLEVELNGSKLFVDWCLQAFLKTSVQLFSDHLGSTDLAWMDLVFRQN